MTLVIIIIIAGILIYLYVDRINNEKNENKATKTTKATTKNVVILPNGERGYGNFLLPLALCEY